jgi:hypothetical protein
MMKILGYDWERIQAVQRKERPLHDTIPTDRVARPKATPEDYELLEKHGEDGLREMGFFGVLDRLANK